MGSIIGFMKGLGVLPPHESAYGIQLAKVEDLSNEVRRILSLEFFDPHKTEMQVSGMAGNGGIKALTPYCAELAKHNSNLEPLVTSLKEIEKMQPVQESAARVIDKLVEYRADLRDEAKQDETILFIKFGLKDPTALDPTAQEVLRKLVERVDTPKQFAKFTSRQCPGNYLKGNINIYPRLIENTSWYQLANLELADQTRPILALRFMGLGGVLIYILDQIEARFGCKFFHLDGESIDADRQEVGSM